jgi:hypothetical protein
MNKGEELRNYIKGLGVDQFIVLASVPDSGEGGFSVANGDGQMLTSLLTMFFKDNPELLIQTIGTIMNIYRTMTVEQIEQNAANLEGCDCENCSKRKEKGKGGVDLNDFIAKGNLH